MGKPNQSLRDQQHAETVELAKKAFERHVITRRTEGRWLLQRIHADGRPESTFATEVIATWRGELYVGGDIDLVGFGIGPNGDVARVYWMGEHSSWGYIAEKAGIGSSRKSYAWDHDVACDDLKRWIKEREDECKDNGELHTYDEDEYEYAMRADTEYDFYAHAEQVTGDFEAAASFGEIVDSRVVYAWAALNRLSALLREEEKAVANG